MQVRPDIVGAIAVDVVDDFPCLSASDFAMFPFPARTVATVPQAMICAGDSQMRAVAFYYLRSSKRLRFCDFSHRTNHSIPAAHMCSVGHSGPFPLVGIQRIAVALKHLIMAIAEAARHGWTIAVQAWSSDYLSSPSIFSRAVSADALVMHEAQPMRSMLATASTDRANARCDVVSHSPIIALGNSMCVNVLRWIGERIEKVEQIEAREVAA